MRSLLSFIVTMVLSPLTAHANPMPVGSTGRELVPYQLKPVSGLLIAEESVDIIDGHKTKLPSFAPGGDLMSVPSVRYVAKYVFVNRSGKTQTVKVGFPVATYAFNAGGGFGDVDDFAATYDGKKLSVERKVVEKPTIVPASVLPESKEILLKAGLIKKIPELPEFFDLKTLGPSNKAIIKSLAGLKDVTPTQRKKISDEVSKVLYSDDDFTVTGQQLIWYISAVTFPAGTSKLLEFSYSSILGFESTFGYILKTGAFWGGTIGALTVTLTPDPDFLKNSGSYKIEPTEKFIIGKDGRFTFKGKNVRPDFDISVTRVQ